MKTPLVSVITPAYNAAPYIGQAIESMQAQTLSDWEMIIVDDASTDATATIVQRYLSDPRIKLLQNDQNMGAGYTRNRALDAVQGEWVAVLDADDWYAPQRLEKLVAFATAWEADMVGDPLVSCFPDGSTEISHWASLGGTPPQPFWVTPELAIREEILFQYMARAAFLRDRDIRYVEHIRRSQDYAFQMEAMIKGARTAIFPEPMYYYRIYHSPISGQLRRDYRQLRETCVYLCNLPQTTPALKRQLRRSYTRRKIQTLYLEFVSALRSRHWREMWAIAREEPRVVGLFLARLPRATYRRWLLGETISDPRQESKTS